MTGAEVGAGGTAGAVGKGAAATGLGAARLVRVRRSRPNIPLPIVAGTAAAVWLVAWLDNPALRGALSGFGVVHFAAAWAWLDKAARRA